MTEKRKPREVDPRSRIAYDFKEAQDLEEVGRIMTDLERAGWDVELTEPEDGENFKAPRYRIDATREICDCDNCRRPRR